MGDEAATAHSPFGLPSGRRGKILFTPDTPAVRSIMERVNATFNKLLFLPGFEEVDSDTFFSRLEGGFLVRVSSSSLGASREDVMYIMYMVAASAPAKPADRVADARLGGRTGALAPRGLGTPCLRVVFCWTGAAQDRRRQGAVRRLLQAQRRVPVAHPDSSRGGPDEVRNVCGACGAQPGGRARKWRARLKATLGSLYRLRDTLTRRRSTTEALDEDTPSAGTTDTEDAIGGAFDDAFQLLSRFVKVIRQPRERPVATPVPLAHTSKMFRGQHR